MKFNLPSIHLWKLLIPFLLLANLLYFTKNIIGWVVVLSFFLIVPGFLLLEIIRHEISSKWVTFLYSLGLSILILMLTGLVLNSLNFVGLKEPLSSLNIFIALDVVTSILIFLEKFKIVGFSNIEISTNYRSLVIYALLSALPMLSMGGAIRLNNGASNILTMILFVSIASLFIFLTISKNNRNVYPYALFTFALSILFSTSLRGWYTTGHDIQHEFEVFRSTNALSLWTMVGHNGDPYNACLSITILPTILDKITGISPDYIFKVVFQIIFAFGITSVYFLANKFKDARTAFMAGFVFISFPTFFDDMPFLNRQEIAFVLFGLLALTTFSTKMSNKSKTILSVLLLFGLILSHYSSGYTALFLIILGKIIFSLICKINKNIVEIKTKLPILSLPLIIAALLFAFLWNVQVTVSASNLRNSVAYTFKSLIVDNNSRSGFVQYSLLNTGSVSQSPSRAIAQYAGNDSSQVKYKSWNNIPETKFGRFLSKFINITDVNYIIHSIDAKIFQLLLLLGVLVLYIKNRAKSSILDLYYFALVMSSTIMLILWTILPQISLDYSPIRLFQQTLIITSLPIVMATEFIFGFTRKFNIYFVSFFLALLFLDLSGFIPQSIGDYLPQLSLNNSGQYYDFFYAHKSDIVSSEWLSSIRVKGTTIYMDTTSSSFSYLPFTINDDLIQDGRRGYLYLEFVNTNENAYRAFLSGLGLSEYSDPNLTQNRNIIYSNYSDKIYGLGLENN